MATARHTTTLRPTLPIFLPLAVAATASRRSTRPAATIAAGARVHVARTAAARLQLR